MISFWRDPKTGVGRKFRKERIEKVTDSPVSRQETESLPDLEQVDDDYRMYVYTFYVII